MAERIGIIGAGSWGMAIANLLASGGHDVLLWEPLEADRKRLQASRTNEDKLQQFRLDDAVQLVATARATAEAGTIVLATPSQFVRQVIKPIGSHLAKAGLIVNLAKGIENRTLCRISELVAEETGTSLEKFVALSGPSHAEEVVRSLPTTVVAASESESSAEAAQELFSHGNFRVYKGSDLVGVELGGALKNIIAIAAGIVDGLGMGDNTKGALLTRGLAEITRLGVAMGARAETFAGLSGVGDLITTCTSSHSRNRSVGERIGRGESVEAILADMKMVAEGVPTTRSGWELARRHKVEMPITNEIYQVLFKEKPPAQAVGDLMGRKLRAEVWQ